MTGRDPEAARPADPGVTSAGGSAPERERPGSPGAQAPVSPSLPAAGPGDAAAQALDVAQPGRRAFGRVVDASGQGLSDAQVACFREAGGLLDPLRQPLGIAATTDGSGAFELLGLPTDGPLGLDVRHPGFA